MSKVDVGGLAFPSGGNDTDGMTLRDYFAAKAMQALVARATEAQMDGDGWDDEVADHAYYIADKMIERRVE